MSMALISLLGVVLVFIIGAFRNNPLHLGVLSLLFAYFIGRYSGFNDVKVMSLFPTVLFVRVFGIMLFFGIAQANGSLTLLARKMLAKIGGHSKFLPFFVYFVGVIMGSLGIQSLAGMAIMSGVGISLAQASGGNPLLFGIAGGYGVAVGCYSPINEYVANITAAAERVGLSANLLNIYILALVAYTISFAVIYTVMGGYKSEGELKDKVMENLPSFTREQVITMLGILVILGLVVIVGIDVGWAGIIVAVACILLGCSTSIEAVKNVSLGTLILICGVGTLIALASELGGIKLVGSALTSIMSSKTAAPVMSLTASAMSLFTLSRLVVLTLVPTIPTIVEAIPNVSVQLILSATAAGAFASSIGPLSANGALIMQNLGQQIGEETAMKYFTVQMLMSILGGVVVALVFLGYSFVGIF